MTIILNEKELALIVSLLEQLPYKDVSPVITMLAAKSQINNNINSKSAIAKAIKDKENVNSKKI